MKTIQTGIPSLGEVVCELYTLTLNDGTAHFFNTSDSDILYRGHRYRCSADNVIAISRGAITTNVGIEVSTVDVTFTGLASFNQIPAPAFARNGGFDNAHLMIERARADKVIHLFEGTVSDVSVGRYNVQLRISSDVELLNIQMPRNLYEANCIHTVFDAGCGLNKGDFSHTGSVLQGSTNNLILSGLTQDNDYFSLGTIDFTSGDNAGSKHTIKSYTNGSVALSFPLENQPQTGDSFTACAGCNGTEAVCTAKFNNIANFRAFPYIPAPTASV